MNAQRGCPSKVAKDDEYVGWQFKFIFASVSMVVVLLFLLFNFIHVENLGQGLDAINILICPRLSKFIFNLIPCPSFNDPSSKIICNFPVLVLFSFTFSGIAPLFILFSVRNITTRYIMSFVLGHALRSSVVRGLFASLPWIYLTTHLEMTGDDKSEVGVLFLSLLCIVVVAVFKLMADPLESFRVATWMIAQSVAVALFLSYRLGFSSLSSINCSLLPIPVAIYSMRYRMNSLISNPISVKRAHREAVLITILGVLFLLVWGIGLMIYVVVDLLIQILTKSFTLGSFPY